MIALDRMTAAEIRATVAALDVPPVDYFAACRADAQAWTQGRRDKAVIRPGRSRYTWDSEGSPEVLVESTERELCVAVLSIVCDGTRKSGAHPPEPVARAYVAGPDENGDQANLADALAIDSDVVQWLDADNRVVTRRGQRLEDLPEYLSGGLGAAPFRANAVLVCPHPSCGNAQVFALSDLLGRLALLYAVPGVIFPPDRWPAADVTGPALELASTAEIDELQQVEATLRGYKGYDPKDETAALWAAEVLERLFLRVRLADISRVPVPARTVH